VADDNTGSGDGLVEVNVGYDGGNAREAVLDAAAEVVRELESLRVLTVRLPRRSANALAERGDVRYVESNGEMGALDE
jgi:hypothetical protein